MAVELGDWLADLPAETPLARAGRSTDVAVWGGFAAFCGAAGLPLSGDGAPGGGETVLFRPRRAGSGHGGAALPVVFAVSVAWLLGVMLQAVGPAAVETTGRWMTAAAMWIYLAAMLLLWAGVLAPRLRELPAPPVSAEWRPRPGAATTRRFRRVARVRCSGRELVVVDADGSEQWLGGPGEPTGVRSLVFTRARRADPEPAQVALVTANGTALAWLSWPEWAGGEDGERAVRAFAARAGLEVAERVHSRAGELRHLAVPRPARAGGVTAELRGGVSSALLVALVAPGGMAAFVESGRAHPRPLVLVPAAAGLLLGVVPLLGRAVVRLVVDRTATAR